jgi:hypothetical protein
MKHYTANIHEYDVGKANDDDDDSEHLMSSCRSRTAIDNFIPHLSSNFKFIFRY